MAESVWPGGSHRVGNCRSSRTSWTVKPKIVIHRPVYQSDANRLHVIKAVLDQSGAFDGKQRFIELHLSPKAGCLQQLADAARRQLINPDGRSTITIFKWEQKSSATECIRDNSSLSVELYQSIMVFAEGKPGETTDIQFLPETTYRQRWSDYQESASAFDLVERRLVPL